MYRYFIPFYGWIIFHLWTDHILFIHWPVGRHLGCFHFLSIMNNVTINICVLVFNWTYIFISLGFILGSAIAGSYGDSTFKHFRNCQTVFQRRCTILRSHQQGMRALISPYLCQHLLLPDFFNSSHLLIVTKSIGNTTCDLLATRQANRSRDELLGRGIATLFGKPADREDVGLQSQRIILPKLEFRLLLY